MKRCVFGGPSLSRVEIGAGVTLMEPAMLGSVFAAVEAGYRVIGLVDGYFGNVPAVWHKEILYAIGRGVRVFGSSSIGALRAAELDAYGMHGVGLVYRIYRSGRIRDDDEVCVLHVDAEGGFRPVTEAFINTRAAARRLARQGSISRRTVDAVVAEVKSWHFSARTRREIVELIRRLEPGFEDASYADAYVDHKARDAARLMQCVASCNGRADAASGPFPETRFWIEQFHHEREDLPGLVEWAR